MHCFFVDVLFVLVLFSFSFCFVNDVLVGVFCVFFYHRRCCHRVVDDVPIEAHTSINKNKIDKQQ